METQQGKCVWKCLWKYVRMHLGLLVHFTIIMSNFERNDNKLLITINFCPVFANYEDTQEGFQNPLSPPQLRRETIILGYMGQEIGVDVYVHITKTNTSLKYFLASVVEIQFFSLGMFFGFDTICNGPFKNDVTAKWIWHHLPLCQRTNK